MIQWTLDKEEIPLFHINGNNNRADLLAKPRELEVGNVHLGSDWQDGLSWIKIDTGNMPVIRYDQLTTDKATECFDEPFKLSANFQSQSRTFRLGILLLEDSV